MTNKIITMPRSIRQTGRPRRAVNIDKIRQLRAQGTTLNEIAARMGCGRGTVARRLAITTANLSVTASHSQKPTCAPETKSGYTSQRAMDERQKPRQANSMLEALVLTGAALLGSGLLANALNQTNADANHQEAMQAAQPPYEIDYTANRTWIILGLIALVILMLILLSRKVECLRPAMARAEF